MTRKAYEAGVALDMGHDLAWMRKAGYHSFPDRENPDSSGWGHVAIPPNGEGEIVILSICRRGVARYEIQPFGGRSA